MAQFRHEDVAAVPRGYHVRTIHSGEHEIRAAFPPGRRRTGSGVLVSILHPVGENPSRCKNAHSSVYSYATSLGYPYLRGEGRVAEDGRTWLSRVTKNADGSGGAIFVGWDSVERKWVVERDKKNNGEPTKLEQQRAARERGERIRKARLARGPRFRDVGRGNNPDPASYTYSIVYKSPETGRKISTGGYWRKDAERIAEYMRGMLKKRYGKRVAVEVKPDKRKIVDRILEKVFPNPEDQLEEATRLYETFHGREPNEVLRMHESAEQSGDYTGLGDLVELVIVAPSGDEVLIKFKKDGVRVGSSPDGGQIYFFGGNQDISGHLNLFGIEDASKVLLDLGEAKRIVYEAAKWQTDFTEQEWKHDFGEESGVRPRAFFRQSRGEHDPARIFLAGGNYKVERPGIVD